MCDDGTGHCTLRAAMEAANASGSDSVIDFQIPSSDPGFANGVSTIVIHTALPDVVVSVDFTGPGAAKLIVQAKPDNGQFRVFNVTTSGTVNFLGLTISGGVLPGGGAGAGIANMNAGTVIVTNCILKGNVASGAGAISNNSGVLTVTGTSFLQNFSISSSGAIDNATGMVTLTDCTFSKNTSANIPGNGAIGNGSGTVNVTNCTFSEGSGVQSGAVANAGAGTMNVLNSTFNGNSATGNTGDQTGAGAAFCKAGTLNVTNCTISGNMLVNTPGSGAGGLVRAGGTVNVKNTIIALNSGTGFDPKQDVSGAFVSGGFNIVGKKDGSTGFTAAGDRTGTNAAPLDPGLDPNGLQDNGGATKTIALLTGSIAIDQGSGTDNDQRGLLRPYDDASVANATGGNGSDIGAFEVQATPTSTPTPTPTPTATPTATATPTPTPALPAQLLNLSTRKQVGAGDNVLIGGFIVAGTADKKVLVRGLGPSLPLSGTLADDTLEIHAADTSLLAFNNDWRDTQEPEITATGIPPPDNLESAIVITLAAKSVTSGGAGYTAILAGRGGGTGIGLLELYDLDTAADSKLVNISTRGFVGIDPDVLIGGFIPGPADHAPIKVLVRGLGPSVPVSDALQDPLLELHDGNGGLLESNDNWHDAPNASEIAATLPPQNDAESAILTTLAPSNSGYTAVLRGADGTTGVALVEVYAVQ